MRTKNNLFYFWFVFFLVLFMILSLIAISSASLYLPSYLGNLPLKQFIWYLIGFIVFFLIGKVKAATIFKYSWFFYSFCILLLILLFPFGTVVNNSRCWFNIPGIGSFQPSEFMKIALILVFVVETKRWRDKKNDSITSEFLYLAKMVLILIVPSILTFFEPDTGAVFLYVIIFLFMTFISGLRIRWFVIGSCVIVLLIALFFYFYIEQRELFLQLLGTDFFYRIDRILAWQSGTGFQLENALVSIGSSGFFGHGFYGTPLYFPESGTDFIFAVLSSNFGFIGSISLVLLLLAFNLFLLKVAIRSSSFLTQLFITGTIGILLYQQIQNIGMTLGALPITGITLPFISYGGSSLVSYFILMGIIFSLSKEKVSTLQ